jgi:hypothetical protein
MKIRVGGDENLGIYSLFHSLVCLFAVLCPLNYFSLITIAGEGLQNLGLCFNRSRPLSREGS